MAHDVFISYSSTDTDAMKFVVRSLEKNGIRCWYAPRDIKAGEDWAEAITKAIKEAKIMVVLLTEAANISGQVLREISSAVDAGLVLIPVNTLDHRPEPGLQFYLQGSETVKASRIADEKPIRNLTKRCKANLRTIAKQNGEKPSWTRFRLPLVGILILLLFVAIFVLACITEVSPSYTPESMIRTESPEGLVSAFEYDSADAYAGALEASCQEAGIPACKIKKDTDNENYRILSGEEDTGLWVRCYGPFDERRFGEDSFCAILLSTENSDVQIDSPLYEKTVTAVLSSCFRFSSPEGASAFARDILIPHMDKGICCYYYNYRISGFKKYNAYYLSIVDVLEYMGD